MKRFPEEFVCSQHAGIFRVVLGIFEGESLFSQMFYPEWIAKLLRIDYGDVISFKSMARQTTSKLCNMRTINEPCGIVHPGPIKPDCCLKSDYPVSFADSVEKLTNICELFSIHCVSTLTYLFYAVLFLHIFVCYCNSLTTHPAAVYANTSHSPFYLMIFTWCWFEDSLRWHKPEQFFSLMRKALLSFITRSL